MMKKCSSCQIEKPLDDFNKWKNGKMGRHNQCRDCAKLWKPNAEQRARSNKRTREWNRIKSSGFTQEDYNNKLIEQDGKCAICGTTDSGKMDWHADHDHETGQKRGLLCHKCNTGIGLLKDDVDVLCAAIDYLNKYKDNL
jgi:hypothetical protein